MTQEISTYGCRYCGRELPDMKDRGPLREYCSAACRSAAWRERQQEEPRRGLPEFARRLDEVLATSGLSAREVVRRLAEHGQYVATGTLSQWRNGRALPRRSAESRDLCLALERVTGARPAYLVVALHQALGHPGVLPARQLGVRSGRIGLAGSQAVLERRIEETSVSNRGRLALVEQSEHYRIGPDGWPVRSTVTCVLVALRPGVDRYWCKHTVEPASPVELRPRAHCRLGRELEEPGDGVGMPIGYRVVGCELLLDYPLAAGELYRFQFTLQNQPGPDNLPPPEPEYGRVVLDPACRRLQMRVTFDAGRLPAEVRAMTWRQDEAGGRPLADPVVPLTGRHVERTVPDPQPLAYGFRWSWDR